MVLDRLNRPMRDLRISVTDKCNFRCPYCMPIEIFGDDYQFSPKSDVLTFEEITRLTRLFVRAGTEKVRLTGGEPLLRKGLPELIRELAEIEGVRDLTLTTNGWFLAQQARELKAAGLHRVTVSLDALDDAVAGRMNGRGHGVQRVLEAIAAAQEAGLTPVKVNAVIKRGENEHQALELVRRFRGTGVSVRFIEYMDVGNRNGWRLEHVVPSAELFQAISREFPLEPVGRGYRGEVAERYRFRDGAGEVGFISSISQPFCGDCTRARLSTDGKLFTCLFAGTGTDLRGPMRDGASDEELLARISGTWSRRTDRYSEERTAHTPNASRKIEMYQIGG
jgi:cyclic pyranopterin phosphate synthase